MTQERISEILEEYIIEHGGTDIGNMSIDIFHELQSEVCENCEHFVWNNDGMTNQCKIHKHIIIDDATAQIKFGSSWKRAELIPTSLPEL